MFGAKVRLFFLTTKKKREFLKKKCDCLQFGV